MNFIILCEGETDQILISYYFIECLGFSYCKDLHIAPGKINPQNRTESICRYKRNNDNLIIWAVGGHSDLFCKALEKILRQNKINSPSNGVYSHICVVTDHDDDEELNKFWNDMGHLLKNYHIPKTFQEKRWIDTEQPVDFSSTLPISLLGISVPADETGALETILLNALSEDEGNVYIVQESRLTIRKLLENKNKFSPRYLSGRREKIKAPFAVFLAITDPKRTFEGTGKILESIPWNKYQAIQELFAPFDIFSQAGRRQRHD